jgi:hypothetical protein
VTSVLVIGGLLLVLFVVLFLKVQSDQSANVQTAIYEQAQLQQKADASLAKVRADNTNDASTVIPLIEFADLSLPIAVESLARELHLNCVIEPGLRAELENSPMVFIRWEKLRARQALLAILDSRDLQLVENSETGVARITRKTADTNLKPAKEPLAVAQNLSFGPVVERVVEQCCEPDFEWFDLDKGIAFSAGNLSEDINDPALEAWLRKSGGDVAANSGSSPDLISRGDDFISLPVLASLWDSASAEKIWQLAAEARPAKKIALMLSDGKFPATFVFKTREGGTGLLQITGFTENPRGVKIRYKLVQNGGDKK